MVPLTRSLVSGAVAVGPLTEHPRTVWSADVSLPGSGPYVNVAPWTAPGRVTWIRQPASGFGHPDAAAVQVDRPAGDRQPQAGAAVVPGRAGAPGPG